MLDQFSFTDSCYGYIPSVVSESVAQELRCVKITDIWARVANGPMNALFASGSLNLTGKQAVSSARSLQLMMFFTNLQFNDR